MLLGQETTSGTPLDFIQYGVLGLVIVSLLLGWLWAKPAVEQLRSELAQARADKARAEAQRDALMETMNGTVLTALAQSSQVHEAMRPILAEVVKALEEHRSVPLPRSPRG